MTFKRAFLIGLLLLAMVATPLLALAQDEDEIEIDTSDWTEYTSEDEVFTLLYPPDWFVGPGEEVGSITIANSESLLETVNTDDPAAPGEKIVAVFALFPADLMSLMGVELTDETTAEELIGALSELFMADVESNPEDDTEFGEPDLLVLSDESEIGVIKISSESDMFEGYFLARLTEDGIVALGLAAAYTGEFDAEYEATVKAILENLEINITGEQLMEMMNS